MKDMPRRKDDARAPRDYAIAGTGDWPRCRVSGPPWVHAAAELALMLEDRLGAHSVRSVAERVGLDPSVIARVLRGEAWPNALPLLRICAELDIEVLSRAQMRRYRGQQLHVDFAVAVDRPELLVDRSGLFFSDQAATIGSVRLPGADLRPRGERFLPDLFLPESRLVAVTVTVAPGASVIRLRALDQLRTQFDRGTYRERLLLLLECAPDPVVSGWMREQCVPWAYPTEQGSFADSTGGELLRRIRARKACQDIAALTSSDTARKVRTP